MLVLRMDCSANGKLYAAVLAELAIYAVSDKSRAIVVVAAGCDLLVLSEKLIK